MTSGRTRLSPDQRRAQLLGIGASLFAGRPYDEVRIEEIAELAGVSRGLMYRYFATKRDLFRAIVQDSSDRLQAVTETDSALPIEARIAAGLDAFLARFEENVELVRAANAGAASADEVVRSIVADGVRRQEDRLLEQVGELGMTVTPRLRVSVRGWLLMTRALALDWLDHREIARDELRDICETALLDLLARQSAAARAPRTARPARGRG